MKAMIVLLATVILGIAIAAMVLSFKDTTQSMTDSVRSRMETQLGFESGAGGTGGGQTTGAGQ